VHGKFDWSTPSEEVHAFVNDLERAVGTHLLGRRMYEVLKVWDHPEDFAAGSEVMEDFARVWRATDKIVFSRTLETVSTMRTRLERNFDAEAVRSMKEAADMDMSVGGPGLAAHALKAGLVDEIQLFLNPIVVGGGKRALPDGVGLALELVDERRFANGVVHLRYRTI
jgi:dihydrofolate reductase